MANSPTSRTLEELRRQGWTAAVVERWNPHARIRQDLFGCIDVIAIKPGLRPMGIQACAGASHAARKTKSCQEPRLITWLAAGCNFEIWSWSKRGARGKKKLWTLRAEQISGVQVVREQTSNKIALPGNGAGEDLG